MAEHVHQTNGIEQRVQNLENTVFGDRGNSKEQPGLIVEQLRMGMEQKRTNEILSQSQVDFRDFRDELKRDLKKLAFWFFSLVGTAIATSLFALIFKHT